MVAITIYGIKNCDTMKKAFAFLDQHGCAYTFHDYKKEGIDRDIIADAITSFGWEEVINRKGTTWRALPDEVKASVTASSALKLAADNPSIVKRPLLKAGKKLLIGFDAEQWVKSL